MPFGCFAREDPVALCLVSVLIRLCPGKKQNTHQTQSHRCSVSRPKAPKGHKRAPTRLLLRVGHQLHQGDDRRFNARRHRRFWQNLEQW